MKPYLKTTIITVLIAAAAYAVVSLLFLASSVQTAKSLRDSSQVFADQAAERKFEDAIRTYVDEIQPSFSRAESRARFSGWLGVVPVARQPYLAYRELLTAGRSFMDIADEAFARGIRIENGAYVIDPEKIGAVGLERYASIIEALQLLQQAGNRLASVSPELVPESLSQDWSNALDLAEQLRVQLEAFQPFISDLPTILGQDEPYDILVLLQNPHELRATGGFIGTFGRLTFDRGRITTFFTDDIYNLDVNLLRQPKQAPPAAMQTYLRVNEWYVRDANWYPDFPTTSEKIIELYTLASGESDIDMIVALTPAIVEEFLAMTGPITVDGITFTDMNLIDELEFRVEQEFWRIGLRNDERKKIINDLAQALKTRFFALDTDHMRDFAQRVQRVLREKDILLYSTNEDIQNDIVAAGWGGELRSSANDYLMVVDSNFGALKTDRVIDRDFSYQVSEQPDGTWIATLQLTYANTAAQQDYRTARYRTYTRVYVPFGSELREYSGFMLNDRFPPTARPDTYTEEGKTVFAGFLSVDLGQSRTVSLTYALPSWLNQHISERQQYGLLWQKQPGTETDARFVLEARQNLYSFAPSQLSYTLENSRKIRASSLLDTDQAFTVKFAP